MSKEIHSSKVRVDIQALRAIAILAVAGYHLWPAALPGGFVGVDIFFVISGYLITGQLWRQVSHGGRVRFADFWARRARRLLPASLTAIAATTLILYFFAPASLFLKYKDEVVASSFYWQNFALIGKQTNYLLADNVPSPLQHFWSLSVEEQYYIVWPVALAVLLVLATAFRSARKPVVVLGLGLIFVASLAASVSLTGSQPDLAYFSTFTRAWEFAAGALLAVVSGSKPELRSRLWFWVGLGLMLISIFALNSSMPFPGWLALLPVAGAGFVLFGGQSQGAPTRVLALRPIQFIGDISYSFYLWHWPLIVLLPWVLNRELGDLDKVGVLVLSVLLAWLSKRFIEDPVRFGWLSRRARFSQLALGGVGMAAVAALAVGLVAPATAKVDVSWAEHNLRPPLSKLFDDKTELWRGCFTDKDAGSFKVCERGDLHGKWRVGIIGDSHSRQYAEPVFTLAKKYHWHLFLLSKSACPIQDANDFVSAVANVQCQTWNSRLSSWLAANPLDLVINSNSTWITLNRADTARSYRKVAAAEIARGARWLIIRDNPKPKTNFAGCIEKFGATAAVDCAVSREQGLTPNDSLADALATLPGATVADLTNEYCTSAICLPIVRGMIVYHDYSHISMTFAKTLATPLDGYVPARFKH